MGMLHAVADLAPHVTTAVSGEPGPTIALPIILIAVIVVVIAGVIFFFRRRQ
jgi:hypothetical protein